MWAILFSASHGMLKNLYLPLEQLALEINLKNKFLGKKLWRILTHRQSITVVNQGYLSLFHNFQIPVHSIFLVYFLIIVLTITSISEETFM